MRLFKFLNINASTVRSITVANCRNLGKGEELRARVQPPEKMDCGEPKAPPEPAAVPPGSSNTSVVMQSSSESEVDTKTSTYESDTEMTTSESEALQKNAAKVSSSASDLRQHAGASTSGGASSSHQSSDFYQGGASFGQTSASSVGTLDQGGASGLSQQYCGVHHQSEPCMSNVSKSGQNTPERSSQSPCSKACPQAPAKITKLKQTVHQQRSSPVKRDVSAVSGSPPSTLRKAQRKDVDGGKDNSKDSGPDPRKDSRPGTPGERRVNKGKDSGPSTSGESSENKQQEQKGKFAKFMKVYLNWRFQTSGITSCNGILNNASDL